MDDQLPKHLFKKLYLPQILACLLLLIAVYFLRQQRGELQSMVPYLQRANPIWLSVAGAITLLYILLQSGMYVSSFAAVGSRLRWWPAIELFLKRNLLSVFVPGGGVSALAYTPDTVKRSIITRVKIHQASGLFAFAGLLSLFIVGLPILFLNLHGVQTTSAWFGLLFIAGISVAVFLFFKYNG